MSDTMKVTYSGSGMGGGKSGDDKNSLRSNATAVFIDLIAEGEIVGLVDGDKSIYFGETPLMSPDGTVNFKGVTYQQRLGTPDQDPFPGANATTEISVGVEVKQATPISRNLTDSDYTSARVTMRIPSLFRQKDSGSKATSVKFKIEVKHQGGVWENPFGDITISGKNTSPYDKSFWFPLPKNPAGVSDPWTVRVTRITADSDDIKVQDDTFWVSVAAIIDESFIYPDTAMIGMSIDSDKFGQSVSQRMYEMKGRISPVPTNYDPVAGTYSGIWDGRFKTAYHSNPAWAFYDMLTHTRFGLGEFVDAAAADKWALYTIGKYCDELVPDGYGGWERRFTINGYFEEKQDAYEFMQTMASIFRGITYWSSGLVTASQDSPTDPELLVTAQNVEGGIFNYSSSALNTRHTVIEVAWKDPKDLYREVVEVVRDTDAILRYGVREKKITALACTSRGEARRIGRWMLFTEQVETQALNYVAGLDHSFLRPGSVIEVLDKEVADVDFGGRAVSFTTAGDYITSVTLDRPVTLEVSTTYQFAITRSDMSTARGTVTNVAGETSVLTLGSCQLGSGVVPGAIWVLSHALLQPKYYRVVTLEEKGPERFEIAAIEHQPGKYATIDGGVPFDPPVTRREIRVLPPTDPSSQEQPYFVDGVPKTSLTFSWKAPEGLLFPKYDATVTTPDGDKQTLKGSQSVSVTVNDVVPGDYTLEVETLALNGGRSTTLDYTHTAAGWTAETPEVINLVLADNPGQTEFKGQAPRFTWAGRIGGANAPVNSALISRYEVVVVDTVSALTLRTEEVTSPTFTYDYEKNVADTTALTLAPSRSFQIKVRAKTTDDVWSAYSTLSVTNSAPAAPAVVVTAGIETLFITVSESVDLDYKGTKVWVSTSNPPDTGAAPTFAGIGTFYSFKGVGGTPYYVKAGQYDVFSDTPVNFSTVATATAVMGADVTAPGTPAGLALSSALASGVVRLTASWTANGEADLLSYDVEIKEGAGAYVGYGSSTNTFEWIVKAGIGYTVRLRAVDKSGNASAFCTPVAHTATTDTVAPATPTGLAAVPGFNTIWLNWAANTEADLDHYEVYELGTSTPAPIAGTAPTFTLSATSLARTGLGNAVQKYYWLRAVDTSGNKSAWTASVNGTTVTLGAADITDLSLTASEIANGAITTNKLLVTGRANAINTDPTFADASIWSPTSVKAITDGSNGAKVLYASAYSEVYYTGAKFDVDPTKDYLFELVVRQLAGGNKTFYSGLQFFDASGASISWVNAATYGWGVGGEGGTRTVLGATVASPNGAGGYSYNFYFPVSVTPATNWETYKLNIGASQVCKIPPNAVRACFFNLWNCAGVTATEQQINMFRVTEMASGRLIVDGSITAGKLFAGEVITLSAQIKDAIVTNAKITELSAAKLTAGTALAGSITVSGTALSTIQTQADDPATRVNAKATQIDPGKILISGGTSLANWRNGTDNTKIEGGNIAANTITANKLTVGNRGVTTAGLQFEHNSPSADSVSWTAGTISYVDDTGATASVALSASSYAWTTGTLYVYWQMPNTVLSVTNSLAVAMAPNSIVLVSYRGGADLVTEYGRTVIDGGIIKTGSVTAAQIAAGTITATQLAANTIVAGNIAAGTITGTEMAAGTITAAKMATGTLTANEIATATITADKMSITDLAAISANLGSIVVGTANIGSLVVGTSNIQNNAVTSRGVAYTAGTNNLSTSTFGSIMQSLVLNPEGYDIDVYVELAYKYISQSSPTGAQYYTIKLRREGAGGAILRSKDLEVWNGTNFVGGGIVSMRFIDTGTPSINKTYEVYVEGTNGTGSVTYEFSERYLVLTKFKK